MASRTIEWLYGLRHFGVKLGLDQIRALLDLLDHPERSFRSVHVAGTNGKGSVAGMVDAMLGASGVRSGLFTSPHLVRPNERIRIEGHDIASDELDRQLDAIRERIEDAFAAGRLEAHPSFFEVMTATALTTFRDHELDAAVLEVGLGGRLDATNAVEADVAVITHLDLDHMKTLGGTLRHIAREKAGIIKPGQPVVSGVSRQVAVDILRDTCRRRGAELIDARLAVRVAGEDRQGRLDLVTDRARYPSVSLGLPGRHQIHNARVAIATYECFMQRLGRPPQVDAVCRGLAEVRWSGRLQTVDLGPGRPGFLLDAAHNPAGVRTLVHFLEASPRGRPVLLFGLTTGKPLEPMLAPLARFCPTVVLTRPPVDRGIETGLLREVAEPWFERVEERDAPEDALKLAESIAGPAGLVLVAGSLYLIGQILGRLEGHGEPRPIAM